MRQPRPQGPGLNQLPSHQWEGSGEGLLGNLSSR